jgi:hypothetical protein
MYGQLFYAPELSYHDLYEHEHRLLDTVTKFLSANGATHLDFTPDGDSLRFQCEFDIYEEDLFHVLSDGLSAMLTETLEGRLLFVDKATLSVVHVYTLTRDKWQEAAIGIPRSTFFEK